MEEEKKSIEGLMAHMLNSHYKELCDKIKVEILNSLIKLTEKRKATDGKKQQKYSEKKDK